jgi:hypothetical protein
MFMRHRIFPEREAKAAERASFWGTRCDAAGAGSKSSRGRIRLGGGGRSANVWEINELNADRGRAGLRNGCALSERKRGKRRKVRHWPTSGPTTEHTILGI